jgi:glycosyltransferase involved in cell wall biosynthesis
VIWVQDLWPESLAATGFIRNPWLLKMVGWLVRGIYTCADTLLIQSKAFQAPVSRYARADKIIYYPNSVDVSGLSDEGGDAIPDDLATLLESNFCVVFAGNIGKAQAVENLVDAAINLKDLADCKLVLVGSGSMLKWIQERKVTDELDNLILAGRFPMNVMPQIYQRAACLVVTLKNEEIFSYTIPSKVQAYLAAGKPILAALNGEGARVVSEASAGLTCPAEDAEALSQAVRSLYAMTKSERELMGAAGRAYFFAHFEMNRQAQRLVEIFEQRIATIGGKI